ncbi:ankyrin repeat-containing domain protein [Tuber brumale]|nr:ankyrin repeat-containing domain protein [Tuber brumale]
MSLPTLPTELLLLIISHLQPRDLKHLIETSKKLHIILTPHLHHHALQSKNGLSALCWAAKKGHIPLVSLLLSWGLAVNDASGPYKKTPLQVAVTWNREEVVKLLLSHGADLEARDIRHETALHTAVEACYTQESIVRILLDAGADIKAKSRTGLTALHFAVESGDVGITQLLLERGVEVNAVNVFGATALYSAMQLRRPNTLVRLLLSFGADPNRFHPGETKAPLHLSVDRRDLTITRMLLENGASIDVVDLDNGDTPIHRAIKNSDGRMFRLLLEFNPDMEIQDRSGKDALAVARYRGEGEMVVELQTRLGLGVVELSLSEVDEVVEV